MVHWSRERNDGTRVVVDDVMGACDDEQAGISHEDYESYLQGYNVRDVGAGTCRKEHLAYACRNDRRRETCGEEGGASDADWEWDCA